MQTSLMRFTVGLPIWLTLFFLMGCSQWAPVEKETARTGLVGDSGRSVDIQGLESCAEPPGQQLKVDSERPIIILVHGLRGSAKSFARLSQQLQIAGHQPLCFIYDDRDSLVSSSAQLAESIKQLVSYTGRKEIAILGHSLGALVARKALVAEYWEDRQNNKEQFKLITVSGPFGGISTASGCTSPTMKFLTLGLVIPLCKMVSGDKWAEITYRSEFIRHPGRLSANVSSHLKIETDEEQGCLVYDEKICRISDSVFTLNEQRNPRIDQDRKVNILTIRAGHVGILGNEHILPSQLISALEKNRVLPAPGTQVAGMGNGNLVQGQSKSAGSSGQSGY